jgi:hypothetical protein
MSWFQVFVFKFNSCRYVKVKRVDGQCASCYAAHVAGLYTS